jgi:signal transduction histidine kinase
VSSEELRLLAEEQAALRRVATLVARGTRQEEVFAAVVDEVGRLLSIDLASMCRYEGDGTITFVASWGTTGAVFPVGARLKLGGKNLATIVFETGRRTRVDGYADVSSGTIGVGVREVGIRSAVATPIMVEGRLWGVISAGSTQKQPLPAESRAAIAASRARIVATADETRRRIERDLHDRAQQRLVSLGLELRAAQATVPPQLGELEGRLSRIADGLAGVFDELREISRGIHPAILSEEGLEPALKALARRSIVPVELDLRAERRLPSHVEVAAYYVVSEALTNAAKHANASVVHVELDAGDTIVRLAIRDDGLGGADLSRGSGLVGLSDRVEALGGTLQVTSPPGGGTRLVIDIPLDGRGSPSPGQSG